MADERLMSGQSGIVADLTPAPETILELRRRAVQVLFRAGGFWTVDLARLFEIEEGDIVATLHATGNCVCLECRVRRTCDFHTGELDIGPVMVALGTILGECMAHVSTRDAKRFAALLLSLATRARVAVQHSQGTA